MDIGIYDWSYMSHGFTIDALSVSKKLEVGHHNGTTSAYEFPF